MDPGRRRLIASVAMAPVALLGGARPQRGSAATPDTPAVAAAPIVLEAKSGVPPRPLYRYGDVSPGPILRVPKGGPVRIALRNRLAVPTSLDLHGVHVPPLLGGAGPLGGRLPAGADQDIVFTPPDSGTFWFHPWVGDSADDLTAQGLAGVLLVSEENPPDADSDGVLILSDRAATPGRPDTSPLPDRLWINGAHWPTILTMAPGSRVRLRVVNASTAVAVAVACRGAEPRVIAIDGQPSELFRPLSDAVPVGPGARFDLMFDLPRTAGEATRIEVRGSDPGAPSDTGLIIRTDGAPVPRRPPIGALPPNSRLPRSIALEAATRATLAVDRHAATRPGEPAVWSVNGVAGMALARRPLFKARHGTPVTLSFRNDSPELAGFRLHGFSMRLLHDLDDGWEPYWRDSVLVPPGVTHHAAFIADQAGRWLIESPFFHQAVGGLRSWFEVS